MEQIEAEAYNYQIKKQNSKIQFITFTDQLKFNKNKDFYKAKNRKNQKNLKFLGMPSFHKFYYLFYIKNIINNIIKNMK